MMQVFSEVDAACGIRHPASEPTTVRSAELMLLQRARLALSHISYLREGDADNAALTRIHGDLSKLVDRMEANSRRCSPDERLLPLADINSLLSLMDEATNLSSAGTSRIIPAFAR